jgi:16S rRNA (guanine527-N7)-methyltransferase
MFVVLDRIVDLLRPFDLAPDELRLNQISIYIDLLVRWNTRINLTAIRDPEEIVVRHFGESLFTAKYLYPVRASTLAHPTTDQKGMIPQSEAPPLIDVGSGAGFPGLPIKIWNPDLQITLIESNRKKATFLREVIRALSFTDVNVFPARAETHPPSTADVVTLRAVERFDQSLPLAAKLVAAGGRLALLIGSTQVDQARRLSRGFIWKSPIPIPNSRARVLLVGTDRRD